MRSQPTNCLQKSLQLILTKGLQVSIKFIDANWQVVGSLSLKLMEIEVNGKQGDHWTSYVLANTKPQRALWALPAASPARPVAIFVCLKSVATVTLGRDIKFQHRSHLPVALLHHAYFLDNLLQICINRNLFDSHNLSWLLMHCFENRAIWTGKDKVD